MGLIGFLFLPLLLGAELTLLPSTAFTERPASWLEAVARFNGTVTGAPSFAFGVAARHNDFASLRLDHLRIAAVSAEPVNSGVIKAFVATAAESALPPGCIYPVYGMAEAPLVVSAPSPGRGLALSDIPGSVAESEATGGLHCQIDPPVLGRPLTDVDVRVVDGSGAHLDAFEVGEFQICSTSSRTLTAGRWYSTGDLGYLTAAGEVVVAGRLGDVINSRGRMLLPEAIERAAADAAGVHLGGVIAIGVPDEFGSEGLGLARTVQ
jgi:fatty-acyl-CoA synthase